MINSPWDRIPEATPVRPSHRKRPKPEMLRSIPRANLSLAVKLNQTSPPAVHHSPRERRNRFRFEMSAVHRLWVLNEGLSPIDARRGTSVWHFMSRCRDWPTLDFRESSWPAARNMCSECLDRQPMKVPNRRKGDSRKIRKTGWSGQWLDPALARGRLGGQMRIGGARSFADLERVRLGKGLEASLQFAR
jgi:hypothetical protein